MIKLELNDAEARALVELLDLANKSGGLRVAEACVVLSRKIAEAMQRASVPTAPLIEAASKEEA